MRAKTRRTVARAASRGPLSYGFTKFDSKPGGGAIAAIFSRKEGGRLSAASISAAFASILPFFGFHVAMQQSKQIWTAWYVSCLARPRKHSRQKRRATYLLTNTPHRVRNPDLAIETLSSRHGDSLVLATCLLSPLRKSWSLLPTISGK